MGPTVCMSSNGAMKLRIPLVYLYTQHWATARLVITHTHQVHTLAFLTMSRLRAATRRSDLVTRNGAGKIGRRVLGSLGCQNARISCILRP